MACIEARGLRKSFGSTIALDGVDLRVEEGRILGLIGPNGAGKTTALNAILGLTQFQGRIEGAGTRSVDGARSTDARSMLHLRCGSAAALDPGFASAGLRCRSAPAFRSSQGRRFFEENED